MHLLLTITSNIKRSKCILRCFFFTVFTRARILSKSLNLNFFSLYLMSAFIITIILSLITFLHIFQFFFILTLCVFIYSSFSHSWSSDIFLFLWMYSYMILVFTTLSNFVGFHFMNILLFLAIVQVLIYASLRVCCFSNWFSSFLAPSYLTKIFIIVHFFFWLFFFSTWLFMHPLLTIGSNIKCF